MVTGGKSIVGIDAHDLPNYPKSHTTVTTWASLQMTVPVGITMVDNGGVGVTLVPNTAWDQRLGPPTLKH